MSCLGNKFEQKKLNKKKSGAFSSRLALFLFVLTSITWRLKFAHETVLQFVRLRQIHPLAAQVALGL